MKEMATEYFQMNIGPKHPSARGVCSLVLKMDRGVILEVTPHIGYFHGTLEKITENRAYIEFVPVLIDWTGAGTDFVKLPDK
jgi:NADH:ubiquinone oxidoreductase subunit D